MHARARVYCMHCILKTCTFKESVSSYGSCGLGIQLMIDICDSDIVLLIISPPILSGGPEVCIQIIFFNGGLVCTKETKGMSSILLSGK